MVVSFAVLGSLRSSLTRAFTPQTRGVSSSRAIFTASRAAQVVGTPPTAFDDGQRPYQITTPIYYVNDKPHIGHAYTSTGKYSRIGVGLVASVLSGCMHMDSQSIPSVNTSSPPPCVAPACDVIARFMRLSGREVFFLSGTDEHGQKVEQSAAKNGVDPQTFVDKVSVNFRDLLELLNISNDQFIRTTDEDHKTSVQHMWKVLSDKGYIYKGNYEGWYSVRDECFYNESELVDGKAPTGAEVDWVAKEESYFFKLSEFEDRLLQFYEDNTSFIAPESRRNEVIGFVKGGLRDLSISRTSFRWGVPVPDDDGHIMYVWIDALANYISALGYPSEDPESNFQKFWPGAIHVIGKDILRFHAVYWPAMLMAADLPLPKRLFAHGWWTKDGQKISKSLGNVIDPVDLCEKVSSVARSIGRPSC